MAEIKHRVCVCGHKATEHRMTLDLFAPAKPMEVHECLECRCKAFEHGSYRIEEG